jgi:hypothetical protein
VKEFKRIFSRFDQGFLVVGVLCVLALWPFISRAGLPQETDAELHIFRLAELSYLVQGGEWYPRWAPNFYHAYGYPIFNYYAPLSYYAGLPVELLPWFDAVTAVKFVFMLGLCLGAGGMYGFVRDNWGRPAGYVAAAVFLYTPYVQYIDPHVRGVLAESFAIGLFPLALWLVDKLLRRPTAWRWLTAVLAAAAVLLSHNLLGPLFFGLLLAWVGWTWLGKRLRQNDVPGKQVTLACGALLLALALSAFFWLPVFLERDAVNLVTLIGQDNNYDFRTHFLSLREMLLPSMLLDWGATEPAFRFNLGLAQWLLAGVGLVMLVWGKALRRFEAAFFGLATAVLLFLMLPGSTVVWESVSFLPYFQFPWRLLGTVAPLLAVLAGVGVSAWAPSSAVVKKWAGGLTAVCVALPLLLALPLSQPAPWPEFGEVNVLRMSLIENTGRWLGTTSTADYVPATVDMLPPREGAVVGPLGEGREPDRVNRKALPPGVIVDTELIKPLHTRYQISAPEDFLLRLFLFQFPGWRVWVDGELVEPELGRPEGFIVVPVPAGEHVVDVAFGSTPPRTWGAALSLAALLATVGMAFVLWRRPKTESVLVKPTRLFRLDWLALAVVLGITAVFILVIEPSGWLRYESSGAAAESAQTPVFADFGEQIALIGYDVSTVKASPGDTIEVTLYWQAQRPLDINYQVFLHMLRPDGSLIQPQSDKINPGDFPTRRWPTDKFVRDTHTLALPSDFPQGVYTLSTGLWVQSEGWRLPLLNEDGVQIGDAFPVVTVVVE